MTDRYPRDWVSSDDFAERFCACVEMMTRGINTDRALAESVAMIAEYRRWYRAALNAHGHKLH